MGPEDRRAKAEFLRDTRRNKTGFLGVKALTHRKTFAAYIRNREGRKVYCGAGKTAEQAARAYDRMASEIYGELAVLNFPAEVNP